VAEEEQLNPFEGILEEQGTQILSGLANIQLDPTEVDRLFSCENPLILTSAQRAVCIEILRRQRKEYVENKAKKRSKREAKKKPAVKIEGLSLADLDLKV